MRSESHCLRERLGGLIFWIGFSICCLMLIPVCLLLLLVRGVFCAADRGSARVRGMC